ncbi:NAD(P)/FAD-dependent oxidoreductase [Brevibacillus fortis]|uniref:NAD(P)/FAD-dependent oxidoreductase n=1 Tax=Brevibacillus fortis TaxID=2126352 RepID=A0A2P7V2B3_9BACL|nr:NAD(P)/FAD-dependent oxidoreductase [Brevibacillus fortis]MED1782181.1 NAD(P)/FAD-dependent oxidoreductase [Brevibacillus fortis]PSJ93321.1 NAD(P)/FAD-dependent oxidoreductase [Brevibacillus fortis]
MEHIQVLIAGGGIAGLSAAIWCQRLGLSCLLIEKTDRLGGQLHHIYNEITDFPPLVYDQGAAIIKELSAHPFIQQQHIRLNEAILSIDRETKQVITSKSVYRVDFLLIATGVSWNEITALSDCSSVLTPWFSTTAQAHTIAGQDIAVIGGGDRALESAANLSFHARQVYLLVRSSRWRARPEWQKKITDLPNVHVLWETQVSDYQEEEARTILTLTSTRAGNPQTIVVDWILPRIGVHGNTAGLEGLDTFGDDYLQTDSYQRAHSPWIYAVGDVSNGAAYASLSLAVGQAMKAVKHISLQIQNNRSMSL